ncbi:MAG: hypothetical protein AAF985_27215, partial [Bacteroidota bacterium]
MLFSDTQRIIQLIRTLSLVLLLSIGCHYSTLFGQGWERTYGGILDDFATTVLPVSKGNYLVKGLSLNAFGTGPKSAFILKISSSGEPIWDKFIPCNAENGPIISCPNETFATVVDWQITFNGNETFTRPLFVKFDDDGNTIWEEFLSLGVGVSVLVNSMVAQADGGILFAALAEDNAQFTSYIGKFDDQGNLLYLNALAPEIRSNTIVAQDANNYTLIGPVNNSTLTFWTVDELGNLLTTKSYNDMPNTNYVYLMDNEELVFFEVNTQWIKQGRIDANSNLIDSKTIWTGFSFELNYAPTRLEDGFISVGFVKSQGGTPPHRLGLIKTDLDGNVEWTQVPDYFLGLQIGQQAVPAHDGGFLVSAYQRVGNTPTDARVFKTDENGRIYSNTIRGTVAIDSTMNCLVDPSEKRLDNWMVIAERTDRDFITTTDENGHYLLPLDSGTFNLTLQPINPYWESCINHLEVHLPGFDLSDTIDHPVQAWIECPNMTINSTTPSLRPCFTRSNYISYCNNGTVTAEDAYIDITYDSLITPVSSSIPWDSLANNTYRFHLGDLAPLACGNFSVGLFLDCAATTGASY